ncbi:hypothetical protein BJ165DRAFT_166505 [Panaeolus papilionaceus]|nr:hypothetical protein BJ165DRAFT_166505 [Panaeolus papilionaceus]
MQSLTIRNDGETELDVVAVKQLCVDIGTSFLLIKPFIEEQQLVNGIQELCPWIRHYKDQAKLFVHLVESGTRQAMLCLCLLNRLGDFVNGGDTSASNETKMRLQKLRREAKALQKHIRTDTALRPESNLAISKTEQLELLKKAFHLYKSNLNSKEREITHQVSKSVFGWLTVNETFDKLENWWNGYTNQIEEITNNFSRAKAMSFLTLWTGCYTCGLLSVM